MTIQEGAVGIGQQAVAAEQPTLFLRKATGLVRGWSVRDAAIYACLSTNVVALGMYEMSFQSAIPRGQILTAVIISALWVSFLVVAYTGLIVTIPRAGGDYVWQTRILGGPIGFVMAVTGWWFILWLWAPIYGAILNVEFFQPLFATVGLPGAASFFATHNGNFVISIITIVLAGVLVSIGMSGYAKVQKWGFLGALVGFLIMAILLLANSHAAFVSAVNRESASLFGLKGNTYAAIQSGAAKMGYTAPAFGVGPLGASMLLVPMMMFYLLWPNWGATLYGEVRGASDIKRVFGGMFSGLWATVVLSVIFILLAVKTFGWTFYENANALSAAGKSPIPVWPYPGMLAGWLVNNEAFQVLLLVLMSLWFFSWVGTLFLSSTRVIFAAAFDRVLPDWAASVSEKRHVPMASLVLMLLPAVGLSALYAYWSKFATYTLDATLVIAVTYLFSAIAAAILPWRKPELWKASPASRWRVLGVPIVPVAGVITVGLIVFNLYEWLSNSAYGVNANSSLVFMGILYLLAIVLYVTARLVRRRQGIDLALVNKEIPVE